MNSIKILVVEDDLNLSFLLMEILQSQSYIVRVAKDGLSGLEILKKERFDLCLFDIMMPKMNGFNLAKHLKELHPETPFLFLTAKTLKEDKLKGYNLGAEDYVLKPFDEEELLCKIQVVLRRKNAALQEELPTFFNVGKYKFDYKKQLLSLEEETYRITEKENEILRLLCLHKNEILRREKAVEIIYGKQDYFLGRSFDVFISRLRKLLSQDPSVSIENVFKVGFILNVK